MSEIMSFDKWKRAGTKDAKEIFEEVFPTLDPHSLLGRQVYFVFCYPAWALVILIIVIVYIVGLIASR